MVSLRAKFRTPGARHGPRNGLGRSGASFGAGMVRTAQQDKGGVSGSSVADAQRLGHDQASESIVLHNERKDLSKLKKDYLVVQGIHDQGDQGHWKLRPSYTNLLQCVVFLDTTPTHQLDSYTPMHHAPQRLK
jgi:hypothetical protein